MTLEKFVQKNHVGSTVLAILAINVACNVGSSIIYDWLNISMGFGFNLVTAWRFGQLALCGLLLFAGIRLGQYILKFVVFARTTSLRSATPRKVVVCFLSRSRSRPYDNGKSSGINETKELSGFPTKDLVADLARLAAGKKSEAIQMWPWEQPLRLIARHLGLDTNTPTELQDRLKEIVLVCSNETLASAPSFIELVKGFTACEDLRVTRWLRNKSTPHELVDSSHSAFCPEKNGWDFESFTEIEDCLRSLIRQLHLNGYSDRDIAIDFTGGLKPSSVVAAAVTIGSDIVNHYVCTNPRNRDAVVWDYDILEYDLDARRAEGT